ncbi:MAG: DUF4835 family protein [Balneolaceae bacterium]
MNRIYILFTLAVAALLISAEVLRAQEFDCEVTINDRQISDTSYEYVSELVPALERYINENRWTDDQFEEYEKIKCRVRIVLTGVDDQYNFSAEVVFSSHRPIYNTAQESATVIISDNNWTFHYPRNKSLVFDALRFDALTSFIDFYMYVLMGFDYDSFSELGGSPYFNRAMEILELAQMANHPGWARSIGSQRNRYGLIQDLTNPGYEELRSAIYQYHRLGLDQFTMDEESARAQILDALRRIRQNRENSSRGFLFDLFFDTKYLEIVAAFMDGNSQIRLEAYNVLTAADPGHLSEYERLRN